VILIRDVARDICTLVYIDGGGGSAAEGEHG
jgi:hypothetical protein